MTEKTDEIARNVALNRIADTLWNTDGVYDSYGAAGKVAFGHTVTWERAVNEHGQPVRRYVLRGAWEVDPDDRIAKLAARPVEWDASGTLSGYGGLPE